MPTTAKQTAHTPGPWYEMTKGENNYQSAISQETSGKTVALTYTSNDADARLIASCPTMLEALKDAAHVLEPLVQSSAYGSYGYAYDKIIAAIAKAEGRN
jgi:hypothetical protein